MTPSTPSPLSGGASPRRGRKCWGRGELVDPAGAVLADCEALFVELRPRRVSGFGSCRQGSHLRRTLRRVPRSRPRRWPFSAEQR